MNVSIRFRVDTVWTAWTQLILVCFDFFFCSEFSCSHLVRFHLFYRFVGLTLEELYIYLDDPWWRQLRRTMMISLWILLFVIFASACIISIVDNKQRCTIATMKSPFPAINLISADTISRTNYTLSTNAVASNSTIKTAATILMNISTLQ